MVRSLLEVCSLRKTFGGVVATDNLNLSVEQGTIHAIIGPNGAGKTTLISQLSGLLESDSGKIYFDGMDISNLSTPDRARLGLARTFQITSVFQEFTALENVALAVQAHDGHSFRFWRPARSEIQLTQPAQKTLKTVGLDDRVDTPARLLSHGERRQLEISMALATKPRMLLLDEPMAGMGAEESRRMVNILLKLKGKQTILLIEHDMDAVFALADKITVLVYGREIATGSPKEIRADEEVRSAYLGDEADVT
ncbi:MAG: ABC transporter ATP-binding protein [Rhodospirillaceae bacterium]|nr:ABC transporter ATP-binding protein [Rhodospirillaceae bacterium]|tara:strand:- start:6071 stop:6829 length:759 start_codon:yes stop_codon:yes gene_type:complete